MKAQAQSEKSAVITRLLVVASLFAALFVGAFTSPTAASATDQGQAIVDAAAAQSGAAYCGDGGNTAGPTHGTGGSGCSGTTVGFDCSGLALYAVYKATGITLPHGAGMQSVAGGQVISSEADLKPGDLVFFGGGSLANFDHVGVYAGSGMMWDANDYNVPVQQHSLAWEENALAFDGGVRYWSASSSGGSTNSSLAAVSTSSGQQYVFWRGSDSNLYQAFWNGSAWYKFNLGFGTLSSAPTAVIQPSTGYVEVFWQGPGNNLYQAVWNGSAWVGGWNLGVGATVYSQPTVTASGSQVFIYWKDNAGRLRQAVWNGSAWVSFDLGSYFWNLGSAPSANITSSGEQDVYWKDTSGNLVEAVWNGFGMGRVLNPGRLDQLSARSTVGAIFWPSRCFLGGQQQPQGGCLERELMATVQHRNGNTRDGAGGDRVGNPGRCLLDGLQREPAGSRLEWQRLGQLPDPRDGTHTDELGRQQCRNMGI